MTLKGIHCKDKGTNHHLHSKFQAFLVSDEEKSQSKIYYKVDQFLATICMGAHQSLISRCIGCSNAYLANIITSSKLLSDLYIYQ